MCACLCAAAASSGRRRARAHRRFTIFCVPRIPGLSEGRLAWRTRAAGWQQKQVAFEVYVGKRIAILHMEDDGKRVARVEPHDRPIEWCTVTIMNSDLVQRGNHLKRRRALSR